MGATAAVHPTDQILQSYGLGKLDDVSSASVSKHLEGCDSCQRRVAELSSDEFLGRLRGAQIKPRDQSATSWSPSAPSSTEGAPAPVAPPPADTLPPELVDHPDYEIVRELGRGGMGVVYLANNKLMGRQEVLKVVGRHLVERPGVGDRFLREIRSAAKLHHPNIVTAHSALRLGESLVLAMEYVEGHDLAKMVKTKGPLPIAHACYFIHQAALGLQQAHERGMVHRDIKPANLILARDGKKAIVKVLDFGLAKVTSEGQSDSGLTREGQMLGTPDFIAPEQIRNAQSADIRADIYSLGCTFYYLLTGGPPFRGDHLWDVYQAHFSMDAGPLNLVRPEVPVELAALAAKMMAKEPDRRFQTPGEVARALTPFFKPAMTQSTGSSAEVPRVETQVAPTQPSSASAASPPPTTLGATPAPARPSPPTTGADGLTWESLIAIKDDEPLIAAAKAKRLEPKASLAETPVRRPPWVRKASIAASMFAAIALGVIIWVVTDNGRIKIVVDGPVLNVTIDGDIVRIDGLDEPMTLRAGKHNLEVSRGGMEVQARTVHIHRGDNKELRVEYEPKITNRAETIRQTPAPAETTSSDTAESPNATFPDFPPVRPTPAAEQRIGRQVSLLKSIGNSIGMTLNLIPAGEFLMGSTPEQIAKAEELFPELKKQPWISEQPHRVRISQPFYLGAHEVTCGQFAAFVRATSYMTEPERDGKGGTGFDLATNTNEWNKLSPKYNWRNAGFPQSDNHPVANVTWNDAVAFCDWLSRKEGKSYRLPTEAEWEYSCRAGTTTLYSTGDDPKALVLAANFGNQADGFRFTAPIGSLQANGFGLFDMHGNVWEMCADWFGPHYYASSPVVDPTGPSSGSHRVSRGQTWDGGPREGRSASRNGIDPARRGATTGFRVALSIPREHVGDMGLRPTASTSESGKYQAERDTAPGDRDRRDDGGAPGNKPVVAVTSRFGKGDDEGWRTVNEDDSLPATEFMKVDTDGSKFWLVARDGSGGKDFGWLAPEKYNGKQSDKFGRFLQYSIRTDGNGSGMSDSDWYVRLRGQGVVIFVDQAAVGLPNPNQWKTYRIKLDGSGGWKMRNDSGQIVIATDADIRYVLSNLKDLWINGEFANGKDTGCLDDVEFGVDPIVRNSGSDAKRPTDVNADASRAGDGFVPLFNGNDLAGWTAFSNSRRVDTQEVAHIFEGEIRIIPREGSGLRTNQSYKSFTLTAEFMFPIGGKLTKPGSGIIILPNSGDGLSYQRGIECQLRPGESGDFWTSAGASLVGEERHDVVGKVPRWFDTERPPGQWNAVVIRCDGSRITCELNGREVNRVESHAPISGWVGLMNQGSDVRFRKIEIKELAPSSLGANPGPRRPTAKSALARVTPGSGGPIAQKNLSKRKAAKNKVADAFQPGTVWTGKRMLFIDGTAEPQELSSTLTVREREGSRFKARYVLGKDAVFEVNGAIDDDGIRWVSRDVEAIEGYRGPDPFDYAYAGTIRNDQISMTFAGSHTGNGKRISGTLNVRLEK
jgi:formylglycine-generating enzyme required for sulfatase activity/serine/threonine protein kinase